MKGKNNKPQAAIIELSDGMQLILPRKEMTVYAMRQAEALEVLTRIVAFHTAGLKLETTELDVAKLAWLAMSVTEVTKGISGILLEEDCASNAAEVSA